MSSILIVEDEVLTSEYLEFVLQGAGYEAIPAASAGFERNRPLATLLMILLLGVTAAAVLKQLM